MEEQTELEALPGWVTHFIDRYPEGVVAGLTGELGSGKTTLVREIVRQLRSRNHFPDEKILSPSYVIHQQYEVLPPVAHYDLYRLEKVGFQDLVELGYFESLRHCRAQKGFVFVEWPERASLELLETQITISIGLLPSARTYRIS